MSDLPSRFDASSTPALAPSAVEWYASRLPRDQGTLLIAGGDAGRLITSLAQCGMHAHGVEGSASAVEHCSDRLRSIAPDTPVFRQDLGQLNLPFRYAGALIAPDGWQWLDAARVDAAIARVHAHLIAPGVLLLCGIVPDDAEHPPGAPLVEIERVKLDDASVITRRSERRVDRDAQAIESIERYERRSGAKVIERADVTRRLCWRTPEEMLALVLATGFAQARIEDIAATRPGRTYAIVASL
ncbi:MAG TPA: hypothetical protein VFC24_13505 [Casimicrobiaceae bacterium]|nr:hypothetical protein [Casimicrobiaceae bacterium]